MKCKCGNNKFIAHQVVRASVIVDETGTWIDNASDTLEGAIYDSGHPYGPFSCTECNKEYEELE
jgi:hypothetical protein